MSLSMRNLNSSRAFCFFTLSLTLLLVVVTVSAQGQTEQFIIRVAEQPGDLVNEAVDNGAANAGGEFTFEVPATGLGGSSFGAAELLQAPDVVVEGLNMLQRNNLVAAAGHMEKSKPQQRARLALSSGLRRRSVEMRK